MAAKDPALAELIRSEQDLSLQINALLGTLNNTLALAPSERDEEGVKAIKATLAKMRDDHISARNEIARRFPSYADLIDPKPPEADAVREVLRLGEALLSFYFGYSGSFVWVVPKDGPVAFEPIASTAGDIETKVRKLRATLDANVDSLAAYPPYDLALAYELYELLLKPVEHVWKPANSLVVVTNGALGMLPLSLLPPDRVLVVFVLDGFLGRFHERAADDASLAVTVRCLLGGASRKIGGYTRWQCATEVLVP